MQTLVPIFEARNHRTACAGRYPKRMPDACTANLAPGGASQGTSWQIQICATGRAPGFDRAWKLADHIMSQPRVTRRLTTQIVRRPWKRRITDDLAPMKSPVSVFDPSAFPLIHQPVSGPMRRHLRRVPRSKLNLHEFIGGFERLAIACRGAKCDARVPNRRVLKVVQYSSEGALPFGSRIRGRNVSRIVCPPSRVSEAFARRVLSNSRRSPSLHRWLMAVPTCRATPKKQHPTRKVSANFHLSRRCMAKTL
jgi:hypothetical protein